MRFERNTGRTTRLIAGITGIALGLTASLPAVAADKYVLEEVDETPVEFGTGWYIRGDISVTSDMLSRDATITGGGNTTIDDISTTFGFRVGAGVRIAPKLRLDATFDYHSRSESETSGTIPGGCAGEEQVQAIDPISGILITTVQATTIVNCRVGDEDQFDSQDLMVNAYYDLASTRGFTPYVGVGIGATRLNYASERGRIVCNPLSDQRCADVGFALSGEYGEVATSSQSRDNGSTYHLAGAITLGVGYQVSKNVTLDASYQFTKTVESPLWGGSNGYDVVDADSARHALRFGLRYELW